MKSVAKNKYGFSVNDLLSFTLSNNLKDFIKTTHASRATNWQLTSYSLTGSTHLNIHIIT